MTLHGDLTACIGGCGQQLPSWTFSDQHRGWKWPVFRAADGREYERPVCPACRARHTDDELRDLLARKETP